MYQNPWFCWFIIAGCQFYRHLVSFCCWSGSVGMLMFALFKRCPIKVIWTVSCPYFASKKLDTLLTHLQSLRIFHSVFADTFKPLLLTFPVCFSPWNGYLTIIWHLFCVLICLILVEDVHWLQLYEPSTFLLSEIVLITCSTIILCQQERQ